MRLFEMILLEAKDEYVAKTFGQKIAKVADIQTDDPNKLNELVLNFVRKNLVPLDPTANQKFLVWIGKLYADGKLLPEDFYKVPEYLNEFMSVQQRLPVKDIMKYGSLPDLIDAIDAIKNVAEPGLNVSDERQELINQGGAEIVYQNKGTTVVKLNTKEASCEFGRGTRWCTAAANSNQFQYYNANSELYVIYIKGEKPYQVEVGRNDRRAKQIHDASDRPLTTYDPKFLPFFEFLDSIDVEHTYNAESETDMMTTPVWPQIRDNVKKKKHSAEKKAEWVRSALILIYGYLAAGKIKEAEYIRSEMEYLFGAGILTQNIKPVEDLYKNILVGTGEYEDDGYDVPVYTKSIDKKHQLASKLVEFLGVSDPSLTLQGQIEKLVKKTNNATSYYDSGSEQLVRLTDTEKDIDLSRLNKNGVLQLALGFLSDTTSNGAKTTTEEVLSAYKNYQKHLNDKQKAMFNRAMKEHTMDEITHIYKSWYPLVNQALIDIAGDWESIVPHMRKMLLKKGYVLFNDMDQLNERYLNAIKDALQMRAFTEKQIPTMLSGLHIGYVANSEEKYFAILKNAVLPNLLPKNQETVLKSLIEELAKRSKDDSSRSDVWQPFDKAKLEELKGVLEKHVTVDIKATAAANMNQNDSTRSTLAQHIIDANAEPISEVLMLKQDYDENDKRVFKEETKELKHTWYTVPWSLRASSGPYELLSKQFRESGLLPDDVEVPENKLPAGRPQMIFMLPATNGLVMSFCAYTDDTKSYILYIPYSTKEGELLETNPKSYKLYQNVYSKSSVIEDTKALIKHVRYIGGAGRGTSSLTVRAGSEVFPESTRKSRRKI